MYTVNFRLSKLHVTPTATRTIRATHLNTINVNPAIASRRYLISYILIRVSILRDPASRLILIGAKVILTNAMSTISRNIRIRVLTGQGTLMLQLTTNGHRVMSINARFNRLLQGALMGHIIRTTKSFLSKVIQIIRRNLINMVLTMGPRTFIGLIVQGTITLRQFTSNQSGRAVRFNVIQRQVSRLFRHLSGTTGSS